MVYEYYYRVAVRTDEPDEDHFVGPFADMAECDREARGNRRAGNYRGMIAVVAGAGKGMSFPELLSNPDLARTM